MNVFNTPNIGDNKTLNEVYLNNAEQAKKQQMIWYKQMKNGMMTPDEYSRLTQNLLDDNKMFTGVVNQAQDAFTRTKERIDKGIASQIEVAQMKKIQEFTDLNNTAFRVDPESGKMIVVKKNADGTISENPNDILSIQSIFSNLGVTVDEYNLIDEVNKDVKSFAKKYQNVIGKGRIQTLDDLRQNPEFQKAIDDAVQSQLVNSNNTASILSQYGNYEISSDFKDKGKEGIIYVDYSKNIPEAVLTPAQEEEAAKIVRSQYEMQIGKSESYRAPSSSGGSRESYSDRAKRVTKESLLESLAKLYYGDATDMEVGARIVRDYLNNNVEEYKKMPVLSIERNAQNLILKTKGGGSITLPFGEMSISDFMEATAGKIGIYDTELSRRIAKRLGNLPFSTESYTQQPIEFIGKVDEITQSDVDEITPSKTGVLGGTVNTTETEIDDNL
jgi:hypothetical protein